jgi:hypothetical protein
VYLCYLVTDGDGCSSVGIGDYREEQLEFYRQEKLRKKKEKEEAIKEIRMKNDAGQYVHMVGAHDGHLNHHGLLTDIYDICALNVSEYDSM